MKRPGDSLVFFVLDEKTYLFTYTFSSLGGRKMNYNWDLKNIYKTEEDFEKDLKFLDEKVLPLISSVEGKLNTEEGMVTYCKCQLDL